MARVRNGPQRCFYFIPTTLVIQTPTDECSDEGATAPRPRPPIKVGHEFIIQVYVQSHVFFSTH